MDRDQDPSDLDTLNERHRRRIALMRMQGDVNRQETRLRIVWAGVGFLAVIALAMAMMS